MFDSREKIALLIDGANFFGTTKSLGFDVDYKKLLTHFQKQGYLIRASYFTAILEDQEFSALKPLVDWLDYNGYRVVTKPAKEFTDTSTGRRKIKGNMDVEIAVDAMEAASYADHIVLFSGDGDFRVLVDAIQRKGRKVTVVSTMQGSAVSGISDDLRRQADHFLDILSIKEQVARDQADRPPRRDNDDN